LEVCPFVHTFRLFDTGDHRFLWGYKKYRRNAQGIERTQRKTVKNAIIRDKPNRLFED
jgi:hypothetical protein